jgi:hypothetical protein
MSPAIPRLPVLTNLKRQWRTFRHAEPGHRFQGRYWRTRRSTHRDDIGPHLERIAFALVAFLIGGALCFTPVPGIPFLAISAGLLASESLPLARALDRGEIRLRALWFALRRRWLPLHPLGRIVLVAAIVCAFGFEVYLLAGLVRRW